MLIRLYKGLVSSLNMLHLKLPTEQQWVNLVERGNLQEILTDHAYCEQKAASSCISIIQAYPEFETVVEVLTPVVIEEWQHFARVHAELKKRGLKLGQQRKDEYVNELLQCKRKGASRTENLIDKLLIAALIEARSCERFKLLWQGLQDEELKAFYYDLMTSEATHYVNFIELAREIGGRTAVDSRWQEILDFEVKVLQKIAPRADRVH